MNKFLDLCYELNKNDYSLIKSSLNVIHKAESELKINELIDNINQNE